MANILVLHQHPAGNLLVSHHRLARVGQTVCQQQAQVLFRGKYLDCLVRSTRGDHHLGEDLGYLFGSFYVQRHVQRDDSTEGRGAVAVERFLVSFGQGCTHGHATRVGVFDNRHGRAVCRIELRHQLERSVGVIDVVVAQFFTLKLLGRRNARTIRPVGVKGRLLVAVFAIAQGLFQLARHRAALGRFQLQHASHPVRYGSIIGGGAGIGLLRQLLAEFRAGPAVMLIHVAQQPVIVFHVNDHVDKGVVLSRRTDHRRAADVDVLDAGIIVSTGRHGGFERV